MKAVWYERNGPADSVLVVGDLPTPEPGPSLCFAQSITEPLSSLKEVWCDNVETL